jgi:hypothetical protein
VSIGRSFIELDGRQRSERCTAAVRVHAIWAYRARRARPPLTTLLYWFDVGFLIAVAISYLIAAFLGTPGCEVGGLGELIRRLRGVPDPADHEAMWCIAGIHHLDQWESERHRAKTR